MRRRLLPLLSALAALFASPAHAADRAGARAAYDRGAKLVVQGEARAARVELLNAIKADPSWPLPHAVIGSANLILGDGLAAETEIKRALELGLPTKEVSHLLGHAWLLQGDAPRALELTRPEAVAPRFAGYAARVRALAFASTGKFEEAARAFDVATKQLPKSSALWTDIGRFRFSVGNVVGAVDASNRAVTLNPQNIDALMLAGDLVRGQYGLSASIPWFERVLELDGGYLPAMHQLAATFGDAGRTVDMLAMTRKILLLDPGNANAYYLQAVMAARAKKYDLARAMLYRTQDRMNEVPAVRLLKAALDLQSGNAEQAIADLQELVTDQRTNLTAQRLLGAALWRAGDAKGTIDTLGRIANRSDADSYTLSVIGRAYESQGNRNQAATYLDRAAQPMKGETVPFEMAGDLVRLAKASAGPTDNADTAIPYINKLVLEGRTGDALALAQKLRAQNPGAPAAYVLVGDALMAQNRVKEATLAYRDAAGIRFSEPIAMRYVDGLLRVGDRASALRVLDLFLSQNPRSVPGLLLAADHFMATGQWDNAINILEGLRLRLGNRDATVLNTLGWAWFNKGEFAKAADMSGAAYGMAPANPAFADAYGWILFKSGTNREGGAALLEKAVATAPNHPGLRFHLGQALASLGRKDDARIHLRIAADAQDFPERSKAAALLAGL
jgi:cellulose synthase operon protein C